MRHWRHVWHHTDRTELSYCASASFYPSGNLSDYEHYMKYCFDKTDTKYNNTYTHTDQS